MAREISDGGQVTYYLGMILIIIGVLIFVSNFFTVFQGASQNSGIPGFSSSGTHSMESFSQKPGSMMTRALTGMGFILVGGILRGLGARGLAGSGVILDPDQAREDLEPYSRMAGGMVRDAMDEANIRSKKNDSAENNRIQKVIMIKCTDCGKLNEEDSRFCQECGEKI